MTPGTLSEILVRLYLRLNGYFQSGLIAHSDEWGRNRTEFDSVAIRFPLHRQVEREIGFCPILQPSSEWIEIILAEVKTKNIYFNPPLKPEHPDSFQIWLQTLNWIGLFKEEEIDRLIPELANIANTDKSCFEGIKAHSPFGIVNIRPIIFSLKSPPTTSSPKTHLSGEEILDYIWLCFNPPYRRETCSTRYPFENWGSELGTIVQKLKSIEVKPSFDDLYSLLKNETI